MATTILPSNTCTKLVGLFFPDAPLIPVIICAVMGKISLTPPTPPTPPGGGPGVPPGMMFEQASSICSGIQTDPGYTQNFIDNLPRTPPDGFMVALTTGSGSWCQRLRFFENGTYSYSYINVDQTKVENRGAYSASTATLSQPGTITFLTGLRDGALGAGPTGGATLVVMLASPSGLVVKNCVTDAVYGFIPYQASLSDSTLATDSLQSILISRGATITRPLQRAVQTCPAVIRHTSNARPIPGTLSTPGGSTSTSQASSILQFLIQQGLIPSTPGAQFPEDLLGDADPQALTALAAILAQQQTQQALQSQSQGIPAASFVNVAQASQPIAPLPSISSAIGTGPRFVQTAAPYPIFRSASVPVVAPGQSQIYTKFYNKK